ncbi:MAG: toxin ParE1/3/4 [Alphaproteobacteria bacterium]|nr:toxin ParE1/3/4 [Alphaproteobacteria bacterium]
MRVRYTRRSLNDLDAIYRYLDKPSISGARAVKTTIERRITQLADMPFIAPVTEESGVYELTIIRYPYKVYYRVENDEVQIIHVRHTSRQHPDLAEL